MSEYDELSRRGTSALYIAGTILGTILVLAAFKVAFNIDIVEGLVDVITFILDRRGRQERGGGVCRIPLRPVGQEVWVVRANPVTIPYCSDHIRPTRRPDIQTGISRSHTSALKGRHPARHKPSTSISEPSALSMIWQAPLE